MRAPGASAPHEEFPDWTPPPARSEERAITPYVRAVRAHALLVVLVVATTLGASYAWLSSRSVVYEAEAELLVNPIPADQTAFLSLPLVREAPGDPTRTIQTAAALADTHEAAALAARRLGDPWTQRKVEKAVTVKPQGQTNILNVTATAAPPRLAARVANVYARSIIDVRGATIRRLARRGIDDTRRQLRNAPPGGPAAVDLQQRLTQLQTLASSPDPSLSVSELAIPPASALGRPASVVLILALVAGVVLGTGAALLLEFMRADVVTSEEDVLEILPLPILARLPRQPGARRNKRGVPTLDPTVREAFRSVRFQLDLRTKGNRCIMITSPSSGDGRTRAAVEFTLELAESGSRVILVDGDVRRKGMRIASALGLPEVDGTASAPLAVGTSLGDLVHSVPEVPELRVLDASEVAVNGTPDNRLRARLEQLIKAAKKEADYVVVDTPALGEVSDALTLLDVVDDVIIVANVRVTRRMNLEITRDLLVRAGLRPAGLVLIGGRAS